MWERAVIEVLVHRIVWVHINPLHSSAFSFPNLGVFPLCSGGTLPAVAASARVRRRATRAPPKKMRAGRIRLSKPRAGAS